MKFDAIIFDMDGLLIDSEQYWVEADAEFFRRRNIEPTEEVLAYWKRKLSGQSVEEGSARLKKELSLPEAIEEIIKERVEMTDKIYTDWGKVMPGADSLIKLLKDRSQKMAIASGSQMYRIKKVVDRFGWQDMFDTLVSSEIKEMNSKPAPDIYLHTAEVLGVKPERCVVFEDAENGINAAKAADMMCIGVPDPGTDASKADLVVDSLEDKKIYEFISI